MRKLFLLAAALLLCGGYVAARGIQQSNESFRVLIVSCPDSSSPVLNDLSALPDGFSYKEICVKANWASTAEKVYVDYQPITNVATQGWPIVGTEKECHDWGPNVRLYCRSGVGEGAHEMRVLVSK